MCLVSALSICMWSQVPTSQNIPHVHLFGKPCPKAWSLAHWPKGTPTASRELGSKFIAIWLLLPHLPSSQGPATTRQHHSPSHGGESSSPLSFLSRYRRQPLCTVSSGTRYFSPPTRNSQGPWATPRRPSPHALPEGSAAYLSPRASSSHPGSALAPQWGHNQL